MDITLIHVTHRNQPINGIPYWTSQLEIIDGRSRYEFDMECDGEKLGCPRKALQSAIDYYEGTIDRANHLPKCLQGMAADKLKQEAILNLSYLQSVIKLVKKVCYSESRENYEVMNYGDETYDDRPWINYPPEALDKIFAALKKLPRKK